MKIWIFNNYNMLPSQGGLNRHYFFAKYLQRMGHEPVVFVGSHPHNTRLQMISGREPYTVDETGETKFPWVYVRTCDYEGSKLKRVWSMFQYYRNAKKAAAAMEETPDAVLGSSAHPLAAVLAIRLGKKYGCKAIVEVRDLWPESIVLLGIAGSRNPGVVAMRLLEKWIYKKADAVIFTMEGGYDYIVDQGWEKDIPRTKVFHINNGVDLEQVRYNQEHFQMKDPDLDAPDTFKVVYTGSVRLANNLSLLIDCAEKLQTHPDIRFLIYGGGGDLDTLRQECAARNLSNCIFKGPVPKSNIAYILSKSDLNLLNYSQSASKIYRYGSSQNKMFDYLASGKPSLSNVDIAYNLLDKYYCGISGHLETAEQYAHAILHVYQLSNEERLEICTNALRAAEDYDYLKLTQKLLKVIQGREAVS